MTGDKGPFMPNRYASHTFLYSLVVRTTSKPAGHTLGCSSCDGRETSFSHLQWHSEPWFAEICISCFSENALQTTKGHLCTMPERRKGGDRRVSRLDGAKCVLSGS